MTVRKTVVPLDAGEVHITRFSGFLSMELVDHTDTTMWLDPSDARDLALALLTAAELGTSWCDPIPPSAHRWRIVEQDGIATIIQFEDGFEVDRYACPLGVIFDRMHYRPDGSCRCPDSEK